LPDFAKQPVDEKEAVLKKGDGERSEQEAVSSGAEPLKAPADTAADAILSEEDAVAELRAIPLYFPTSYSLVKPYVSGFDFNSLDAPSLKDVSIDNSWQPK
jgi:hypothetical protein